MLSKSALPMSMYSTYVKNQQFIFTTLMELIFYSFGYSRQEKIYKRMDTNQLFINIYQSTVINQAEKLPAMIFFFGDDWTSGTINQFEPRANYFSQRRIACFLEDYRIKNQQQTSPFESLKDSKSAIRLVEGKGHGFFNYASWISISLRGKTPTILIFLLVF